LSAQKPDDTDAAMGLRRGRGPQHGILFLRRKAPFGHRNTRTGHIGRSTKVDRFSWARPAAQMDAIFDLERGTLRRIQNDGRDQCAA
jgi:hypothetical protein